MACATAMTKRFVPMVKSGGPWDSNSLDSLAPSRASPSPLLLPVAGLALPSVTGLSLPFPDRLTVSCTPSCESPCPHCVPSSVSSSVPSCITSSSGEPTYEAMTTSSLLVYKHMPCHLMRAKSAAPLLRMYRTSSAPRQSCTLR